MKTFLTCLFLPAVALSAQTVLPGPLTAHLKEAVCVHVDFTQTRTLAALTRPLKASGSMVLSRDKGLIWALRRPLAITYVMGPKGLTVVNPDGSRDRKTAKDAPMVAQVSQVFQSVAQGDWRGLEQFFTVSAEGRADGWEVTLLPKPQTAAFVKRIRLDGRRFIDRIRMEDASGDSTELAFQHQSMTAPLTEAEAALLNQ